MKRMRISKQNIKVFLLAVLGVFILLLIYNWEDVKRGFIDGFNANASMVESVENKVLE